MENSVLWNNNTVIINICDFTLEVSKDTAKNVYLQLKEKFNKEEENMPVSEDN